MLSNFTIRGHAPWQNRKGEFSALKAAALLAVSLPMLWLLARYLTVGLGAKPNDAALRETGDWAIRLLLLTLAITPWRLITGDNRVLAIRRILGVAALTYTIVHVTLYVVQQRYDLIAVALEIIRRFYLTIGFAAFAMMAVLGATSFDSAVKRLGAARWNALHRMVYILTILAILHGFIQSKIDVSERITETVLLLALFGIRLMRNRLAYSIPAMLGLVLICGLLGIGIEFLWYKLATGLPAERVFAANFDWDLAPRPALLGMMIGLILPLLALLPRRNASPQARVRARKMDAI